MGTERTLEQLKERYEEYSAEQNDLSGEKHMIALQIERRFGVRLPGEFTNDAKPDERDAEIARLKAALKEAEHKLDVVYSEFADVYETMDGFGALMVEHEVIPQEALDEFRNDVAPYKPLFEAARKALNPTQPVESKR